MRHDVLVVGGGVAGLAAALRFQDAGARVVLVEQEDRLGGLVDTVIEDGFLVEAGPDSFVTRKDVVLQLAARVGIETEVIPARPESSGSYVWWDGHLYPLPGGLLLMVPSRLGPFLRSSLLSWRGRARALADLVVPRPTGTPDDESLSSFVSRRLGREVLERIAEPLVAGIHAADPETMSLRAAFPRFLDMEHEHRSLILAARRLQASAGESESVSPFSSFRLGMGQLTAAVVSALDRVEMRTGQSVVAIGAQDGGYEAHLDGDGRIDARSIVLAVPAPRAAALLEPLEPDAAALLAGIGQVSNTIVTMAYQTGRLPELRGSGFVVPAKQHRAARGVSYSSRKWEGRVPDGFTTVRVFLRSDRSAADPVATARAELADLLGLTASPDRVWVSEIRHGLHRYTVGHLDRMATVERALAGRPGLALAGAGFHGVGLNECVQSGWDAADRVLSGLGTLTTVEGAGH